MKFRKNLLAFLLLITVFLAVGLHGTAAEGNGLLAERQTLQNGLTVLIKNRPSGGQAIVQLWVKAGSYNEAASQSGISHFLEHMAINRGSTNWPSGELVKEVDRIGGEQNGGTSFDYTYYYVQAGSDQVELMLKMLAEIGFEATLAPDQITEEEPVIEEEIRRSNDDTGDHMLDRVMEMAMTGTNYQRPVLGSTKAVKAINQEAFVQYYRRFYNPSNAFLVIAGDVTSAQVMPLVHQVFDRYPAGQAPEVASEPVFSIPAKPNVVVEEDLDMTEGDTVAMLVSPLPALSPEEWAALDLLCEAYGGSSTSILPKASLNSDVIDSIGCYGYRFAHGGLFVIEAWGDAKKAKAFEKNIAASYKRVFSQVDKFEFEKARQRVLTQFAFNSETLYGLADALGSWEAFGSLEDNRKYLEAVKKVQPSDAKAFAAKYLNPKSYTLVVHYNPDK